MSFCSLIKGDYPENSHVVVCPSKQRSFEPFMSLGLEFCTAGVMSLPAGQ